MEELSFDAFEAQTASYDADVARSAVADRFCTSSPWIVPARHAFAENVAPVILRGAHGWAPLMHMDTALGRTIVPHEVSWGLASAWVGVDEAALARDVIDHLIAQREAWDALYLTGLTRGGPGFTAAVHRLRRRWRLGLGRATVRCVASLAGGMDGFMSRRTRTFRKGLRNSARRAVDLSFEVLSPQDPTTAREVFQRIVEVELTSWKGRDGHGIDSGPMHTFYAQMVERLAGNGALRVTLARRDGEPVGYVLGGVFGDTYRGLQISFDDGYRHVGLGNLLQQRTIAALCEEPELAWYDLGTDMEYKQRWAELRVETVPLVVR